MYVVAGATGHTGKAAAESLLARGAPLRVIVRSREKGDAWKARGADIAVASLEDVDAVTRALSGAKGAYLIVPPNYAADNYMDDRCKAADKLAAAIKASGIPHVVFLSSVGTQLQSGTGPIVGLRYAESVIGPAVKSLTVLRPTYFMENWAEALDGVLAEGKLHTFLTPGRQFPMISTTDIGRIAAEHLMAPASGRRVLELEGPRDYSNEDIAAAFSAATHRRVQVAAHPAEALVPTLTASGLKPGIATLFAEMIVAMNSGLIQLERGSNEYRRGTVTAEEAIAALVPQHATH